jgi:hypothetical protein
MQKTNNEKLYALYFSPNIIRAIKSRVIRRARHVTRIADRRRACRVLVGKPERRRPLGRTKQGCEDNITLDVQNV